MKKLKMHSPNLTQNNIAHIQTIFPNCVTEAKGKDGSLKLAVDFDQLRQELSDSIVEGSQERYHLNWPGKRDALLAANTPVAKALRPDITNSIDFDLTKNIFIEGDNLEALKLLQDIYLSKVKLIFIDPPYNTGSDLIYKDDYAQSVDDFLIASNQKNHSGMKLLANTEANGRFHSDWLTLMYPRLKLARSLLMDDGLIFISIDDGEVSNLRKVCDEIFGGQNFVANIIWQKKTSPDARMQISAAHDNILLYAKNVDNLSLAYLPIDEDRRKSFSNPDSDPRGDWASVDLTGQTGRAPKSQFYSIKTPSGLEMPPPEGRCWALAQSTFLELQRDNRIWFGVNGSNRPRLKKFLSESEGVRPWTWWDNKSVGHNQEASQELKSIFSGNLVFDNPKPVRLIQRIVQLATSANNNDIVLDFFAGSASTAHAVMAQNGIDNGNRKFIMVQIPQLIEKGSNEFKADSVAVNLGYESISEISRDRIRKVGSLLKDKYSNLDVGYRLLRVDTSNMADIYYLPDDLDKAEFDMFIDNIKPDRTSEDLLFQIMLDCGVDLALPIAKETIQGKEVFFVDGNALAACFDASGEVDEAFVKELAALRDVVGEPLRKVVFRDAGFKDSAVKINVEQIFKQLSPSTEVKCL
jgi:adenine-specific DNA-methyltransferase